MNQGHLEFLASPEWHRYLEVEVIPWALAQVELGGSMLEVGPGPGLTTDLLRSQVARLVALEIDPTLAGPLAERLAGTNVEVRCVDATDSGLAAEAFDAATSFSMLHHVPSAALQDRLFQELHRLLRPGGVFVGIDVVDTPELRAAHADDVYLPVEPDRLRERLADAGFQEVDVEVWEARFGPRPGPKVRFCGRKARDR